MDLRGNKEKTSGNGNGWKGGVGREGKVMEWVKSGARGLRRESKEETVLSAHFQGTSAAYGCLLRYTRKRIGFGSILTKKNIAPPGPTLDKSSAIAN